MEEELISVGLPEYLANIRDREEDVYKSSLGRIHIGPDLRRDVEAIHWALIVLSDFSTIPLEENQDRAVISFFGLRIFNSISSAFRLALCGYHQVSLLVLRSVLEEAYQ